MVKPTYLTILAVTYFTVNSSDVQFVDNTKTKCEVLYYENYNLENVVMPIGIDGLENLLKQIANCPESERHFVVNGFRYGFSLGYYSENKVQVRSPNLKLRVGDEIDLWNKVMKEVKLKHYAGQLKDIPEQFKDDYIQSPIGLVPKDYGEDTRLIFHLSYPKTGMGSTVVNANTPKELCTVKYLDFSLAILKCIQEGVSCYISKSDFTVAFRNLRMSWHHWRYLIMKARSIVDGEWYFFIDKCLPFGASISCAHFQRVSNAVAHLVIYHNGKTTINYLNDFLFIALLKWLCNQQLRAFWTICEEITFPVSVTKTVFADTLMTFLGFLIDSVNQIIGISREKNSRAMNMINFVLSQLNKPRQKCKITVLQLQRICGFLNFLGRAILPGKAFTRCLYSHLSNVNLKPHHHLRVTDEMVGELTVRSRGWCKIWVLK